MKHLFPVTAILIGFVIFFYPETSISNSTGSPGGKTGSPVDNADCTSCHSTAPISGSTITANIPTNGYVPGTVYTITANINSGTTGFSLQGFEVTSEDNTTNTKTGTFFITDASTTQLVNNGSAVTHTAGGNSLTTWQFDWEAPSNGTGDVTFYGAFIEAGYPQGNSGDIFSSHNLIVSEEVTTSCIDSSLIDSTAFCLMIWDPVCGCDSVTYSNDCYAVNYGGVTSWTAGPCTPPPPCEVEISGDSIICSWSSPQVLTATPIGGTAPYTYLWSNGLSNSSILTVINPGTYCVTLIDASGCTATECFTVSVQDLPIYSAPSPPIICAGDSIVLEIDTTELSNIVWVPSGAINTINRVVDYPMSSTSYVVEALDSAGCDVRGEIFVTVDTCNTSPCTVEINNGTVDIEICDGDTAILEATTGFDNYLWTLSSVGSSLGTSHFIEVSDPGIYIVIATDSTNCVDIDSIEVVVYPETPLNPMTAPDPPMVCLGDSVVIEVSNGFINYWWNTGNPLDQDEDRVVIFPGQDFTYVVEALDSNGCESREEIEVFVDTCATFVSDLYQNTIQIYPNPVKDEFFINLNSNNLYNIEVIDIVGRVLIRKENANNMISISVADFSEGTYFIRTQTNLDVQTYKIIIDK